LVFGGDEEDVEDPCVEFPFGGAAVGEVAVGFGAMLCSATEVWVDGATVDSDAGGVELVSVALVWSGDSCVCAISGGLPHPANTRPINAAAINRRLATDPDMVITLICSLVPARCRWCWKPATSPA
jgi:hypothetical protein